MIHLESLELFGFKSFAHKTKLTFPGNLTGIVGPNGCGKSNLADALRWILGEQSSKLLRGKKAEDVIFAGSSKQAAMSLAQVQLTLHNDSARGDLPPGQIIVLRKIDRSGASDYFINGEKVRATDVQMLLAQANVGVKTYAVIGQGMVEGWLNATPADRRQLLDDAAGLRPLILKRDQVESELEKTQTHLNEISLMLTEIKPRLGSLERQAKKYEKLAELQQELQDFEKKYYSAWQDKIQNEKKAVQDKIKTSAEQEKTILKTVEKWQKNFEQASGVKKPSQELPALQKKYHELLAQKSQLDRKIWQAEQTTISSHNKNLPLTTLRLWQEELTAVLKNEDLLLIRLKTWAQKLAREINNILEPKTSQTVQPELAPWKNALEKIEQELNEAQTKINTVVGSASQDQSELLSAQHQIMASQKELFLLKEKKQTLAVAEATILAEEKIYQQEVALLSSELINCLQAHSAKIEPEILNERPQLLKLQHQIASLGEYDAGLMEEYKTTKDRYEFLSSQSTDLEKTLHQLTTALDDLHQHIKKQFTTSFNSINEKFQEYFTELFGGGKAKLILDEPANSDQLVADSERLIAGSGKLIADESDSHSQTQGVAIIATPPHKKLSTISALSGGEKALTAIALLCAILSYNTSPFVVLDEVDAALDEANSARYATIIKKLSQKTQFIVITHNRNTMQQVSVLYGVAMAQNGISQILSVKLEN